MSTDEKNTTQIKDAVIILKIDPQTKQDAQAIAEELGFSLSSLINAFLKQLIRNKQVTFTLSSSNEE